MNKKETKKAVADFVETCHQKMHGYTVWSGGKSCWYEKAFCTDPMTAKEKSRTKKYLHKKYGNIDEIIEFF